MKEVFKPMHEYILLKPVENETKVNGIIIPDSSIEKPLKGEVLEVGSGIVLNDNTVRKLRVVKGEIVMFGKYSATEIKLNSVQHLLVRESDLMGTVYKVEENV